MAATKISAKRRKLSSPKLTSSISLPLTPNSTVAWPPGNPKSHPPPNPSCTSCHRSLHAPGAAILCARCTSPTCTICSRTCTACAPSQPPPPHLTRSPTSAPSSSLLSRRSALALNSANTNSLASGINANTSSTGKRKKSRELEDDEAQSTENDTDSPLENEAEFGQGCGRTLCRKCCFENLQSGTTTCLDCHGS